MSALDSYLLEEELEQLVLCPGRRDARERPYLREGQLSESEGVPGVHEGGYRVDRDRRFSDPTGSPIEATPPLSRGDPAALDEFDIRSVEATAGDERFDLAYVVDVMLRATSGAPRASP